jgi:hypothetical protein
VAFFATRGRAAKAFLNLARAQRNAEELEKMGTSQSAEVILRA